MKFAIKNTRCFRNEEVSILKKWFGIAVLSVFAVVLLLVFAGCGKERTNNQSEDREAKANSTGNDVIYRQNEIQEPTELAVGEDGILEIEVEALAKPNPSATEEVPAFLSVFLKENADISLQYTYDTHGKEGASLCCGVKESSEDTAQIKPIASRYLAQLSEESYGETWLSYGIFLEKGENQFYVIGGDQTFLYRMTLRITFFEPDKIEKVVFYPAEDR